MIIVALAAGNGPYDEKRFRPQRDRIGQWSVHRLMGQVVFAGEEPQEGSAFLRDVVADRPAQHGKALLERIEERALRGLTLDVESHLSTDVRQSLQMHREYDPDHGSV